MTALSAATLAPCRASDLAVGHVVAFPREDRTVSRVRVDRAGVHVWWLDGSYTKFGTEARLKIRVTT